MTQGRYEAAILDLDGTVYRGEQLVDGAGRSIERLRSGGVDVLFLTNKAIARREDYSRKLDRLGIDVSRTDIMNSGWVTAQYVADHYPGHTAFVVGEAPLVEELEAADIEVTTTDPGDLLVASMDRDFTYGTLDLAMQTLGDDVPFLATNPDRTCPTENGAIPDAAGMIGAIEGVTGRTVDTVLGKPSVRMLETALGKLGVDAADCLMIGDRLETDIEMGNRAGMTTALVLSGVTGPEAVSEGQTTPDHVLESLADIETVCDWQL